MSGFVSGSGGSLPSSDTAGTEKPTYRNLLRNRAFAALFAGHAVSMTGDFVASVALATWIFQTTRSAFLTSVAISLAFVPSLISVPVVPWVVRRFKPRGSLLLSAFIPAVITAFLAMNLTNVWVTLTAMLIVGVFGAIYFGLRAAVLPEVLPQEDMYVAGRALLRISSQATQVVGSIAGGAFIMTLGVSEALLFNAATFVILAALVLVGVPGALKFSEHGEFEKDKDSVLTTVETILRTPGLVGVLLLGWLAPCFAISVDALAAPYLASTGRDPALLSLVIAASGAGMVAGDVAASRFLSSELRVRLILPAAVLFAGAPIVFLLQPNLGFTIAIVFFAGFGIMCLPGLDLLTIRLTPVAIRGTVLSVQFLVFLGIQGVAALVWGMLGSVFAPHVALSVIGALGIVFIAGVYVTIVRGAVDMRTVRGEVVVQA